MFSSENNCGVNYTEQLRGGGAANQEADSPKRWELSSKERNHPPADRAAASSPFQVTQGSPCPTLCALCAPPRTPSLSQLGTDPLFSLLCFVPCMHTRVLHTLHLPLLSGHAHTSPRALTPFTFPPHTSPMISFPVVLQVLTCVFLFPSHPPWSSQNNTYLCNL